MHRYDVIRLLLRCDPFAVTMWSVCCYDVICLLLRCDLFAVTMWSVCCYDVICLLLRCDLFAVTMWSVCCYDVIRLLLRCDLFAVTMWSVCCYDMIYLLLQCDLFAVISVFWGTRTSRTPLSCTSVWRTTASPARIASSVWPSCSCATSSSRAAAPAGVRSADAWTSTKRAGPSCASCRRERTTRWPRSSSNWNPSADMSKRCHDAFTAEGFWQSRSYCKF